MRGLFLLLQASCHAHMIIIVFAPFLETCISVEYIYHALPRDVEVMRRRWMGTDSQYQTAAGAVGDNMQRVDAIAISTRTALPAAPLVTLSHPYPPSQIQAASAVPPRAWAAAVAPDVAHQALAPCENHKCRTTRCGGCGQHPQRSSQPAKACSDSACMGGAQGTGQTALGRPPLEATAPSQADYKTLSPLLYNMTLTFQMRSPPF